MNDPINQTSRVADPALQVASPLVERGSQRVESRAHFFRKLNLSDRALNFLSRVMGISRSSLSSSESSSLSQPATIHATQAPPASSAAVQQVAQPTIASAPVAPHAVEVSSADAARQRGTNESQAVQDRIDLFRRPDQHDSRTTELQDFFLEVAAFGDQNLTTEIGGLLKQINRLYANQEELVDRIPAPRNEEEEVAMQRNFVTLENQIKALQEQIGTRLTEYCTTAAPTRAEERQVAEGVRIVANLLEGFKTRRLLNAASNTHAMLNQLHQAVTTLTEMRERHVADPGLRRRVYGHVTYIREHLQDLVAIERQRPRGFFERSQIRQVEARAQEIKALVDQYYTELNFSDDEVQAFRDLSLEAHRPNRGHLNMFVDDIRAGATRLVETRRNEIRQPLIRSYLREMHAPAMERLGSAGAERLFGLIEKRIQLKKQIEDLNALRDLDPQELQRRLAVLNNHLAATEREINGLNNHSLINELATAYENLVQNSAGSWNSMIAAIRATGSPALKGELGQYNVKNGAIERFERSIGTMREAALRHPDIGNNNNLREQLSMDVREWKRQQERAKRAIQGLFDQLKASYVQMTGALNESPVTTPTPQQLTAAARELTQARNDILGRGTRARWDRPISRTFDVPAGPASLARTRGQATSQVTHTMTCPNRGYPSGANRGRRAGPDCVQPNLRRVEIQCEGQNLCDYTASATNVEFFQRNDALRREATLHQTGEILVEKIDRRLRTAGPNAGADRDHPVVVDVSTTLLLSPDTLRSWIYANPAVNRWLRTHGHEHVDESLLERRMLEESVNAWMAFDRDARLPLAEEREFVFRDREGRERKLKVERNSNGETVFALIDRNADGTEKKTYVQFDITVYNAGCNKWTRMMTRGVGGRGIEAVARTGIGIAQTLGLDRRVFGATTTTYTGEPGMRLEEEINARAFRKDTRRYQNRLTSMTHQRGEQMDRLYERLGAAIPAGRLGYPTFIRLRRELAHAEAELGRPAVTPDRERVLRSSIEAIRRELATVRTQLLDDSTINTLAETVPVAKEIKMLREIERMIDHEGSPKGIRQLRQAHLEAERAYFTAKRNNQPASEIARLNQARQKAFADWQTERQALAMKCVRELANPTLSAETNSFIRSIQHQENLMDMHNEVSDLFEFQEHRTEEGMRQNMYTLSSSLMLFSLELGTDPHTGCRSGKDRTSLGCMELGTRITLKHQFGRHLNYRELEQTPQTYQTRENMVLNSGHIGSDGLAGLNIGSSGLNLSGGYGSYLKNFGAGGQIYPSWYENVVLFGAKNVFAMQLR